MAQSVIKALSPQIRKGTFDVTATSSTSVEKYVSIDPPFADNDYVVMMNRRGQHYWNTIDYSVSCEDADPTHGAPEKKYANGFYARVSNSQATAQSSIKMYIDWVAIHY